MPKFVENFLARQGYSREIILRDAPSNSSASSKVKAIFKAAVLKFKTDLQSRNAKLLEQEYDFKTIRSAIDVESILRQAKEKFLQLMWKNGYSFIGKNVNSVDYVKLRLAQIAIITGTPTSVLLDNIADELITYNNVFIVAQRDAANAGGGKPYMNVYGKSVNPIAGLFLIPASHTKPFIDDKTGRLLGWKVEGFKGEDDKFFLAESVIHIYMSRVTGNRTGTPMMLPVLDDCRALRKMEENAEALVYQHAIPLFKYIVGNEKNPTEDENEIAEVKTQIEGSDPHGMFVIPFNHDIIAVGNGASPIEVDRYLRYFRQRIISGLGLSSVAFGEGDSANRGTAIVQDRGLQDGAKKFLGTIKTFFDELIIREFLQEGGFNIMDPLDQVHLFTPEIDVDAKIAKENHVMGLYQGNCITENEMRAELGRDPVSETDRELMYWNLVGIQKALIMSADEGSGLGVTGGVGGGAKLDIPKGTAVKIRPVNQQGTKTSSKPKANDFIENSITNLYMMLSEGYDNMIGNIMTNMNSGKSDGIEKIIKDHTQKMYNKTKFVIGNIHNEGWIVKNSESAPETNMIPSLEDKYAEMLQILGKDATILLETHKQTASSRTDGQSDQVGDVVNIFDTLRFRLNLITKTIVQKAFNAGSISAMLKGGPVTISDGNGSCGHQLLEVVENITDISQIPPHGQNCKCGLAKKEQK
jgi:hypothetical protein